MSRHHHNLYKGYQYKPNYDRNDGLPGVVYILHNEAMRAGVYKIGQSTRSGHARANDLNRTVGTETPKLFKCIFELHTADCGRAEKAVHLRLKAHRMTSQEYFDVDLELAKMIVIEECAKQVPVPPEPVFVTPPRVLTPTTTPHTATTPAYFSPTQKQSSKSSGAYFFGVVAAICLVVFWPGKSKSPARPPYTYSPSVTLNSRQQSSYTPPLTAAPQPKQVKPISPPDSPSAPSRQAPKVAHPAEKAKSDGDQIASSVSAISKEEVSSLESACSSDKYLKGPAAYNKCRERQLQALSVGTPSPDLTGLSREERSSLESACSSAKYLNGPAAYNNCRTTQLTALRSGTSAPDLTGLGRDELSSLESACSSAKYLKGPAAYNRCRAGQLQALRTGTPSPDLTGLSREERSSLESACSSAKYLKGPAAYNSCRARQLAALRN